MDSIEDNTRKISDVCPRVGSGLIEESSPRLVGYAGFREKNSMAKIIIWLFLSLSPFIVLVLYFLSPFLFTVVIKSIFTLIPLVLFLFLLRRLVTRFLRGDSAHIKYMPPEKRPFDFAAPEQRPTDGTDGLSVAHGAEVSYYPGITISGKGGLPVGGMGRRGRGSFGQSSKDKQDS
ncbi:MAG: hypothetical protein ACFFF4_06325 [Candidatus Thorarchaeota archaeon]